MGRPDGFVFFSSGTSSMDGVDKIPHLLHTYLSDDKRTIHDGFISRPKLPTHAKNQASRLCKIELLAATSAFQEPRFSNNIDLLSFLLFFLFPEKHHELATA